jgi:PAS domain-containing protein
MHEFRIILQNNKILWIRYKIKTFYENNTAVRIIGICTDITEKKNKTNEGKNQLAENQP